MTDQHTPHSLSDWLNYLSHSEVDFLYRLAVALPDNPRVVNIGAGGGTSALAFLSARPDLHLLTVDLQAEVTPVGGLENERLILEASGVDYSARYTSIAGDSKAVGLSFDKPLGLDAVFVDGDHTREGCGGDIEVWLPHLKPGGVIAIHDYKKVDAYSKEHPDVHITPELIGAEIKPYPGVDKAVDDLLLGRYELVDTVYTLIAFIK